MALLAVRNLTKRFAGLTANSDINLDVPEGSLFAVIGPNGAGKTTFFSMVSGFLAPTAGTIEFAGEDITRLRQDKIAAKGLVRTFQLVQLFKGMTVAENVEVGFHLATKGGVAAALTRLSWFRRQEADVRTKARELLDFRRSRRPGRARRRAPSLRPAAPARSRTRACCKAAPAAARRAGGRPQRP